MHSMAFVKWLAYRIPSKFACSIVCRFLPHVPTTNNVTCTFPVGLLDDLLGIILALETERKHRFGQLRMLNTSGMCFHISYMHSFRVPYGYHATNLPRFRPPHHQQSLSFPLPLEMHCNMLVNVLVNTIEQEAGNDGRRTPRDRNIIQQRKALGVELLASSR